MENKRSHLDRDELEEKLEQLHDEIIEGEEKTQALNPRLDSARELFALIERVRIHESTPETVPRAGLSETKAEDHGTAEAVRETPAVESIAAKKADSTDATERIGRFEIKRQLGQGGYGLVFLARDPKLDRDVALKIPRPAAIVTEQMRARFLTEARAAALLSHPRIVPVYEIAEFGPVCYIVSEYIKGQTLSEWLDQNEEQLLPQRAATIVEDLADALQHAHSRGVLHRDLKPSNVLFKNTDDLFLTARSKDRKSTPIPMITDFGLAKLLSDDGDVTRSGDVLGTPGYMAPEQARGEANIGPAADIYSLGAILYRMITGRKPHERESIAETLLAVQEKEPKSPRAINNDIPRDLEAICLKCLEKSPERRYRTAYELNQDLICFSSGRPVLARSPTSVDRLVKWAGRNPALATSISVLTIVLIAGLITVSALLVRSNNLYAQANRLRADATTTVDDLRDAVDEMLLALANMPEIETAGFEPVRLRLLERVNTYYEKFSEKMPLDPDVRRRHSTTVLKLANVKSKLGDQPGALTLAKEFLSRQPVPEQSTQDEIRLRIKALVFLADVTAATNSTDARSYIEQALELVETTITESDDSHQATIDLAMTYRSIAHVFGALGERTKSLHYINESILLWDQVDWIEIEDADVKNAYGTTLVSAALSHGQAETKEEGIEYCQLAIDYYQGQVENESATDAMLYDLARAYRIMSWFQGKDLEQATVSSDRAMEILSELIARHPLVPRYQRLLLGVKYSYGLNFFIDKQYDRASPVFESNIQNCEQLLIKFPEDQTITLTRLADSLTMLGLIRGHQNDSDGRYEILKRSETINLRRYADSGGSNLTAVALSGVEAEVSKSLFQQGKLDEAMEKINVSNKRLSDLISIDPDNGEAKRFLTNGYGHKSEIYAEMGEFDQAIEALNMALTLDVEHLRYQMLNGLVKWNLLDENFEEAVLQAERLVEFCRTRRDTAIRVLPMFSGHRVTLDRITESGTSDETDISITWSQLSSHAVDLIEWVVESATDPAVQLQQIDESEKLAELRDSEAFQIWRATQ